MRIFLICLAIGAASGVVYDLLYVARAAAAHAAAPRRLLARTRFPQIVTAVCDLIYAAYLSAVFVCASVYFSFPDVRAYMFAAIFIGIMLYIKSFHIMVAFFVNKLYNRCTKR